MLNALWFDYYTCSAYDFRTVPNAKMVTSLLKEIVETRAINEDGNEVNEVLSLVDTSFLIDPVWDSAKDLSHYDRNEAGLMIVIVTGNKLQMHGRALRYMVLWKERTI